MPAPWRWTLPQRKLDPTIEAWIVGVGLGLTYWVLRLDAPLVLGAFHDDAVYVALGKALAEGRGYHSIYAAGSPVHLKYPPGLPALYALFWLVGRSLPTVASLAVAASLLATAAAAALLWWFGRVELGLDRGIGVLAILGPFLLDPTLLYLSLPLSEPFFLLGWAVLLVLARPSKSPGSSTRALLLGIVASATVLVRAQALGLVAGLLVALAVRRTPARLLARFAAAALVPLALWHLLHAAGIAAGPISSQPDEASYLTWLPASQPARWVGFAIQAFRTNWAVYWDQVPRYLSHGWLGGAGLLVLGALLCLKGVTKAGRAQAPLTLTLAANVVVVMLWPWPQDRFALSTLPVAGLLTGVGLQASLESLRLPLRRAAWGALVLVGLSVVERQTELRPYAYRGTNPGLHQPYPGRFILANRRLVTAVATWLAKHSDPADRVLADAPAAVFLYSGRQAVAAAPAQSLLQRSWFDQPGAYLASRILDDSVTVVVLTDIRHPLVRDIAEVFKRCPGVLRYQGNELWWDEPARAFFYRVVQRQEACLARLRGSG